jgi:hypothetical protein
LHPIPITANTAIHLPITDDRQCAHTKPLTPLKQFFQHARSIPSVDVRRQLALRKMFYKSLVLIGQNLVEAKPIDTTLSQFDA